MMKNNSIFNTIKKYAVKYSTISVSNHLLVSLSLILITNYIIVNLNLSVYILLATLVVIFFLSMIRGNLKYYDIHLNNNGQITTYENVKYKYLKKKDHLIIFHADGTKTLVKQGNYSITEREINLS